MSLRLKTLIIIGIILTSLVVVLLVASQTLLLNSYQQLENQDVRQDVERVRSTLTSKLTNLSASSADYARWDDTYTFIEDKNAAYIDANLADPFFVNLQLNLMVFVNTAGEQVFAKAVDLKTGQKRPLPDQLENYLKPDSLLLRHADKESEVAGIIALPEGPLLVASRPILDSLAEKPLRGALIFGQFLDAERIQALEKEIQFPLNVQPLANAASLPDDFRTAQAAITAAQPIFIQSLEANQVAGYTLLNDITGQPALLLRVMIPRTIYNQGQSSISLFVLVVIGIGLLFALVTIVLLESAVVRRITRLSADVNQIRTAGTLAGRVVTTGTDELSRLGGSINEMLAALEQAQFTLHQSDERLRTVVKGAPILLWATDQHGTLLLLEGEELKTLGLHADQGVGQPAATIYRNVPQIVAEMERALRGESIQSIVPVKDLTFDTRYTPVRDAKGQVIGIIGVATNITERVVAEQALSAAYEDLERQQRQFDRARLFFRSSLDQLDNALQRDAAKNELDEYLDFVRTQFDRLE